MFQKTKMVTIDMPFVKSIWSCDNVDFSFGPSNGLLGGTLLLWDSTIFSKDLSFTGLHFCGVVGQWHDIQDSMGFINVYGPQNIGEKETLWSELSSIIASRPAIG